MLQREKDRFQKEANQRRIDYNNQTGEFQRVLSQLDQLRRDFETSEQMVRSLKRELGEDDTAREEDDTSAFFNFPPPAIDSSSMFGPITVTVNPCRQYVPPPVHYQLDGQQRITNWHHIDNLAFDGAGSRVTIHLPSPLSKVTTWSFYTVLLYPLRCIVLLTLFLTSLMCGIQLQILSIRSFILI
jgi:hypothetical protein